MTPRKISVNNVNWVDSGVKVTQRQCGPRVLKQRFEGAVEFQRDYDRSRAVQTRNGSYCRFAYVSYVFYFLINHIELS